MTTVSKKSDLPDLVTMLARWYHHCVHDWIDTGPKRGYILGVLLSLPLLVLVSEDIPDLIFLGIMMVYWPLFLPVLVLSTVMSTTFQLVQTALEYYSVLVTLLIIVGIIYLQYRIVRRYMKDWYSQFCIHNILTGTGLFSVIQVIMYTLPRYNFGLKGLLTMMVLVSLSYFYPVIIVLGLSNTAMLDIPLYLYRMVAYQLSTLLIFGLGLRYLRPQISDTKTVTSKEQPPLEYQEPDIQEPVDNNQKRTTITAVDQTGGVDVVIDGPNIAWQVQNNGNPNIKLFNRIISQLRAEYYVRSIHIVVSAKFYHDIKENEEYLEVYEQFKEMGILHVAPAGSDDDKLTLDLAQELDAIIISNDRFRDHTEGNRRLKSFLNRNRSTATWLSPVQKFSITGSLDRLTSK